MRRLLIAPFLGASLLIAGPAFAATGTHSEVGPGYSSGFSSAGLSLQQSSRSALNELAPTGDIASEPIQLAYHDRDPLWWLQVGIGNRWHDDDDRWRRKHDWKKDRWHRNHSWYKHQGWKKHHWKKGHGHWKQHSHRWGRDRDWDRDRRHRHRDWDRDYRWGDDRRNR